MPIAPSTEQLANIIGECRAMINTQRTFPVLVSSLIVSAICFSYPCEAEIYKYQDEHGNWIFSDKPSGDKEPPKAREAEKEASKPSIDLATKLHEKYRPITPAGKASLAVVGIQSPLVQGSGFFISPDGYILTNKHIIKPTETDQWKELQQNLTETERVYKEANAILRSEHDRLNEMEKALKNYREEIDRADGSMSEYAEAEYQYYRERYLRHRKNFIETKRNHEKSKKEYEKARREFNIQSSSAVLRKSFNVILKDDTEISARLIDISDGSDLALLKIDNYHTPFIQPGNAELLRQGEKVFVNRLL
jgi:hypothetical protein